MGTKIFVRHVILTRLCIVQLSSLALVAQLPLLYSSLGQGVSQLCNNICRHLGT